MRDSLRSLMTKEQLWANCSEQPERIAQKWFAVFPPFMPKRESLPSLFFKERPWANRLGCSEQKSDREWFTPVALYQRANMSNLLRLLMTKEQHEQFALFHKQIALLLKKNEWMAQKTDEQIPNPVQWSVSLPLDHPSWVRILAWGLFGGAANCTVNSVQIK